MLKSKRTYLNLIQYVDLDKWFVSYYLNPNNFKSQYNFVKLKHVLNPSKERIKKSDFKGDLRVVKKISFADGIIHLREKNETNMDLFILYQNDLLVSKINFHQGALAINKNENLVCTTHYQPYQINRKLVFDSFLVLVLRSEYFRTHISYLRAEGIKNEATYEFIGELEIPLPSLAEQQRIVAAYEEKIKEADALQEEAQNLENGIETYLFGELGITENDKDKNQDSILHFVNFKDLEQWGFDYNSRGNDAFFHSSYYHNEKLKNVIEINPKTFLPSNSTMISFIPMECISDEYGKVIELREKKVADSKGYTKFQNGDLIWARITPCMQNGKSAIVDELQNGFGCGSTEYHVLRNSNANLDIKYVYHILRLPKVLQYATMFFTGSAGQQRVPKTFLEEFSIPVPPISVQRKISDHISKVKLKIELLKSQSIELRKYANKEFENTLFQH